MKDAADFKVHNEGAGEGMLEVKCIGPGKSMLGSVGLVVVVFNLKGSE